MSTWKRSVCPLDCPDACGLLVKVENGRVTALRGDPEHPYTAGFICRKMSRYAQRLHSPKRVLEPLLRDGPKGSGRFKPISWDRALTIVTGKMKDVADAFGPQAILPYLYAGHMGHVHRSSGDAFFNRLGASRLLRTICGPAASEGFAASLGPGPSSEVEGAAASDLIIVWGSNTLNTNLHAWPFFEKARKNGARLVVIDPYRNATADKADEHLMLRPGSDAALALAMMQVIIAHNAHDRDFIAAHAHGFKRFAERAAQWPPERAQEICGVEAERIEALALAYARAKAPFIRTGWGPARQIKGGMAMRTIALLPALVGALGKPGAGITRSLGGGSALNHKALTRPDLIPPDTRKVNMVHLGHALTELDGPPIKHLHVYISNPAAVAPDSSRVLAGLAREDLFISVQENFLTDTALMADVVLPSATFLEMSDLYTAYGHNHIQMVGPVLAPLGSCRSLLDVFQDMADRMGFSDEVFSLSEEQAMRLLLDSDHPYLKGIDYERLAQGGAVRMNIPGDPYRHGFNTASGKVEFYSEAMARAGLDPLPNGEPSLDPEGEGRYGLQLITPPKPQFLNSSLNEVESLMDDAGPAALMIHPDDAAARGISEDQVVRVFNDRGHCLLRARISPRTRSGVVVAEGLYGPMHTPGGLGVNQLTSQRLADMGNTCAFHCNLVEVEAG